MEWDGQSIWALGTNKRKGVTVLFNRNQIFDFTDVIIDLNGRYIVCDLVVAETKFRLINIYAPNVPNERIYFFEMISKYVTQDHETILAGDFNCTLNPKIDRLNCVGISDIGNTQLQGIINNFDLEDVWRRRFPEKNMFSWNRGTKASRIDYWLISRSLNNQVDNIDYKIFPFSDHGLVEMTLRVTETKHGKGLWKMNFNITTSELFQKAFRGFWKYWQEKKKEYSDIGKWWDMGKRKIKELTISVARELTCKRKETVTKLEEFILKAQENVPLMELQKNELEEAKRNLKQILEYKGEGARIRSRVNWH
jgi:exonuclease III